MPPGWGLLGRGRGRPLASGAHLAQVLQQRPRLLPPALAQHPQQLLDHADAPGGRGQPRPRPRPALSPGAQQQRRPESRAARAGEPGAAPRPARSARLPLVCRVPMPPPPPPPRSPRPRRRPPRPSAARRAPPGRNFPGTVARGREGGRGRGRAPPPRSPGALPRARRPPRPPRPGRSAPAPPTRLRARRAPPRLAAPWLRSPALRPSRSSPRSPDATRSRVDETRGQGWGTAKRRHAESLENRGGAGLESQPRVGFLKVGVAEHPRPSRLRAC